MPLLKLQDVSRHFGGLKAVNSVNLTVGKGEVVGLIGPNGAGKTTIFNVITGIFPPTTGKVIFDGKDLKGLSAYKVTQLGIARTFQNIRIFPEMTVLDNVRAIMHPRCGYGLLETFLRTPRFQRNEQALTAEAESLLERMNLTHRIREKAGSLPYGEQRRLEIARALAAKPKLLLLDEPAAGMNPAEVGTLVELIQGIQRDFDLSILLIEHQMGLVQGLCQRITVLDFGEVIAEGTPAEVQQNPRVLEAYLGKAVGV